MKDHKYSWLVVLLFTVLTVGIGAIANALPLNGVTTGAISDSFKTYFVPAGYVFSIWGLIYFALFGFTYYVWLQRGKKNAMLDEILPWYYRGAIANTLWIFAWHYQQFLITGILIVTLLLSLIAIQLILEKYQPKNNVEVWLANVPFHIYLGWVSVATIANVSNILWLYVVPGVGAATGPWWAATMMIVAGILAALVTLRTRNNAFAFVVIWAIFGIMVKFSAQQVMIIAGILTIIVAIFALVRKMQLMQKSL